MGGGRTDGGPGVVTGISAARRLAGSDAAASDLVRLVAGAYGVRADVILSRSRGRAEAAHARMVAMYLCHVVLGRRLACVGRLFGRDPKTVAHACSTIEDLRDDRAIDLRIEQLEALATGTAGQDAAMETRRVAG